MRIIVNIGHHTGATIELDSNIVSISEERLTKIKMDGSFPYKSINYLLSLAKKTRYEVSEVCLCHWFNTFDNKVSNKYWDAEYFPNATIIEKDHHFLHASSAVNFFGGADKDTLVIVSDGFGNNASNFSIYDDSLTLIIRYSGYSNSLGLMCQYAADYLGYHGMHDVYKLLGFQAKINFSHDEENMYIETKEFSINLKLLDHSFQKANMLLNYHDYTVPNTLIDTYALSKSKNEWYDIFDKVLLICGTGDNIQDKIIISFFVQILLETNTENRIRPFYKGQKLIVSGGCFNNVRLNRVLPKNLGCKEYMAMPIAGDDGISLGYINKIPNVFSTPRNLYPIRIKNTNYVKNFNSDKNVSDVVLAINNNKIVNILRGNSEIGPRALCNTSTLALPSYDNWRLINKMNNRDSIMPMAPVMLKEVYLDICDQSVNTLESDRYMICSKELFRDKVNHDVSGCSLNDRGIITIRPQIIDESNEFMYKLLVDMLNKGIKMLINTSLNYHGLPIIFDTHDLKNLTNKWLKTSSNFINFVEVKYD